MVSSIPLINFVYLIFSVVVILDEVKYEVEDVFRAKVLHISK